MTDDPKQQQDERVKQEDDRLAKELESLYRRVASLDSAEVASDIAEDPALYYKILQINPDVSLSDIRLAFEKLTGTWDPERYPHVPSWKETSTEKLKEIKNAYERLLLLHGARETAEAGHSTHPPLSTALLPFPENPDPEKTASVRANVNVVHGSAFKLRPWMLAPGAFIAVILVLGFLWPTLYHYEAIRLGGNDYPLRINRLTSHAQYFDGRRWLEPPLRVETPHNVPPGTVSLPLTAQPTGTGTQSESKAAPPPSTKNISPQSAPTSLPVRPTGVESRNEPEPASPSRIKQEITSPDQISVKTKAGGPYSIQISAYPERNKADALAKKMRAGKFAVRVEAVSVRGKGQWHRVLLGQFENRAAALRYLNDHRIGETYPGSFIRKSVLP
ncbi:MAG: SPOR domain-containing protein [Deltaproteobacteria bacterium]|nr:SPOR domain-containing protein [Deltaproteobacteria bacterium]